MAEQQRGSDKHGPALDDQMQHETEGMIRGAGPTHAEEWKETEPTEEQEYPHPRRVKGGDPPTPEGHPRG